MAAVCLVIPRLILLAGDGRDEVAPVSGRVSSRGSTERFPIERLVRNDALFGGTKRLDSDLLLASLGTLDRWDEDDCEGIRDGIRTRSYAHPDSNERLVSELLGRVGGDGPRGQVARERWIAAGLARFSENVLAAYRERNPAITAIRYAYLRVLYVACVTHRRNEAFDLAPAPAIPSRRSGPHGR